MAKAKRPHFFVKNVAMNQQNGWGQCPACREWNTFVEEPIVKGVLSPLGKYV